MKFAGFGEQNVQYHNGIHTIKNFQSGLLESLLSPSKVDWLSKLVFDPLHIDDESLEVDGEGSAALNSAADLDKICGCEDCSGCDGK